MNEILVLLGKRISFLRTKRGLTQEKLAELTHRSTNHISKLELARTNPSFDLLVEISNALKVELMELFNFTRSEAIIESREKFTEILTTCEDKKIRLLYKIYSVLD